MIRGPRRLLGWHSSDRVASQRLASHQPVVGIGAIDLALGEGRLIAKPLNLLLLGMPQSSFRFQWAFRALDNASNSVDATACRKAVVACASMGLARRF